MSTRARLAFVSTVVLVLSLAVGAAGKAKGPRVEGDRLEFSILDLDGNAIDASDPRFAGKVVLVDLWGTWCPPCVSEIPAFIELQERLGEDGLVIVAIAFEGEEDAELRREDLREYVEEQGINYLVLDGGPPQDFESILPAVRDVRGFPVEILIDRSGNVVETRNSYGFKKKWLSKLTKEIENLLGEVSPEPPSANP